MSRFRKQLFKHDPDNGVWGDCHRAAWAAMLDLPFDEVPHFADGFPSAEVFQLREKEFLDSLGLVPISVALLGEQFTPDGVLVWCRAMHPGVMHLLGGTSRNGTDHTVVCRDGEVVLDPAIIGPCGDGLYWLTFTGIADPAKRFAKERPPAR